MMAKLIMHFDGERSFSYDVVSNENNVIKFADADGTEMKLEDGKVYTYDGYNKTWKYMKNTTAAMIRVEII